MINQIPFILHQHNTIVDDELWVQQADRRKNQKVTKVSSIIEDFHLGVECFNYNRREIISRSLKSFKIQPDDLSLF